MARISLADLTAEETTVEMFDHEYRVLAITRSVQKKLEKVAPMLDKLEDEDDADKAVGVLIEAIEALMAPVNGGPPAKKLLMDQWKADTLSLDQVRALFTAVQEASVARPT